MTDSMTLGSAALDALSMQVSILRADGVIVDTNDAWRAFGAENGATDADAGIGTNYLTVCDASVDDDAHIVAEGLRDVLTGEADEFVFEYPCHSPTEHRWFLMRATACFVEGERHCVVTHADITDRTLAEREVQRRNDELQNLVHLLAHDIRNPLSVATGWLSELDGADPTVVERIHSSLERIDDITGDVLALMQSELDATELEESSTGTRARQVWDRLDAPDATLVLEDDVAVTCYPRLFEYLLSNLFGNAVRHAGSDVTVTVGATDCGFFVADDGPGIPDDVRDEVFEPGFSTDTDGTGFGLAIVHSIAEKHGWTVELSDVGDGARFDIRTTPSLTNGSECSDPSVPCSS